MRKRITSLLLTLAMMFSLVPALGVAAGAAEVPEITSGGTYVENPGWSSVDNRSGNRLGNLVHRISVHFPAKLNLSFHFVTFGNRNISHIIRDTHHTYMTALDHTYCSAHPGSDLLLNVCILPISNNHLPLHLKP